MTSRRHFELISAMLLLLVGYAASGAAQVPDAETNVSYPSTSAGQTNTDPPGRVARIQYMTGEVSIQPGGVNDWIAANLNRPLTTSDRVWTDKNSKAELNVGGGFVRLNSETSVTLTNVSDNTVQVQLDQGTVELTVSYLGGGQIYEVDTPNTAFTVSKPGVYKFNVFPDEDQTWVTVRKGQGEATGRGNAVKIKSGEQVRFSGGTSLAHTSEPAPAPDGFDDWASVRDKQLSNSESARYVSPGVIGYQDLDAYGRWQTVVPYGSIWVPTSVPVGWAPYRYGRWVWIAPWGWTWVDNAAWGFAPFHYGRWVYTGGYWGWAPGPYRYWSPCYAPALVGWLGGAGWGVGLGFGGGGWGVGINFGWFPLGWGEPFYPWYHGWHGRGLSSAYIRNVNVTNTYVRNVTVINNNYYHNNFNNTHYANRNVNGAITAAPQSVIARGEAINRYGATVNRSQLMHASTVRGIDASPTRDAMLGGQTPRNHAVPPSSAFNHSVVTRATPPQAATEARLNTPRPVAGPGSSASPGAVHNPGASPNAVRNPSAATNAPAANGHYVPRPPSAGGTAGVSSTTSASVHNVPRPPAQSGSGYNSGATHSAAAPYGSSNAAHPAGAPRAMPQTPSTAQVQHGAGATTSGGTAPAAPGASPANSHPPSHSAPPANESAPSHGARPESNAGHYSPSMPSAVPRPPSNYSYHAAPAYGASSYSGGAGNVHGNGFAGGSSYSAAPNYGNHASYGAAAGYGVSRVGGYTPAPSYSQHAATTTQHYAAPSPGYSSGGAAHYLAPSGSSGGAAHYSVPSGSSGGAAHYSVPSSGGGHYSAPGGGGGSASHGSSGGHSR
jgi:hypothetical protein